MVQFKRGWFMYLKRVYMTSWTLTVFVLILFVLETPFRNIPVGLEKTTSRDSRSLSHLADATSPSLALVDPHLSTCLLLSISILSNHLHPPKKETPSKKEHASLPQNTMNSSTHLHLHPPTLFTPLLHFHSGHRLPGAARTKVWLVPDQ